MKMKALPDKKKRLLLTIESLISEIRCEHGCLHAAHYQRVGSEHEFLLVEEWLSSEDTEAHLQSDAFMVLRGTAGLLSQPLELTKYSVEHKEMAAF